MKIMSGDQKRPGAPPPGRRHCTICYLLLRLSSNYLHCIKLLSSKEFVYLLLLISQFIFLESKILIDSMKKLDTMNKLHANYMRTF